MLARTASAVPYEVFIDVDTEDDLYDLLGTEQISERSFEALLLLFQTRLDLNRAGRDELYLLPNLEYADVDRTLAFREDRRIESVDELVAAGVLSERLARSIEAFVVISTDSKGRHGANGFVRTEARWSGRHDRPPPAFALQARTKAAGHLDTGALLVLTRNDLRRVRWDPWRGAFSVEPESPRLVLPKAYVQWKGSRWLVLAGTHRIGFGQRLTFDVTDQVTPNGAFGDYELRRRNDLALRCKRSAGELERSPCPTSPVVRVTPDFAWTDRLAGIAVGVERVPLRHGWLQAYAWGSAQPLRVQSRDSVNAQTCRDPRLDDESGCDAPRVYVRDGSGRPQTTARYATLPLTAIEPLGGLNLGYFWHSRASLMLTGYGASPRWLVRGVSLDYQEIARKPFGGSFGALGVSGAFGARRHDLFVEVTRSFDRQVGSRGGTAFIARSVTRVHEGELELSVRGYGSNFANPYARPISAPDELDGLRARDEIGVRARFVQTPHPRVSLRTLIDVWRRVSAPSLSALAFARVDVELGALWRGSAWVEYRSGGKRVLLATRLAFDATRDLNLAMQVQHRWHRAPAARGQRDFAAVFSLTGRPVECFRLRVRFRYDIEDMFNNHRLPHTAWLYFESALQVRERDTFGLRYDLRGYLDERDSTRARAPNPEHWLSIEYVFRY